jgi:hypothetical protein
MLCVEEAGKQFADDTMEQIFGDRPNGTPSGKYKFEMIASTKHFGYDIKITNLDEMINAKVEEMAFPKKE